MRLAWAVFVVTVLALGAAAAARTPVALGDTTVTVNTKKDEVTPNDGLCSLGEADRLANGGNSSPDCAPGTPSGTITIVVPAGCYKFIGTLRFDATTTVWKGAGPGPAGCTGEGTVVQELANASVVANSHSANATMSGMTLTGGHPTCFIAGDPNCNGGGVHNEGTLTLRDVLITGNAAGDAFDNTTPGGGGGGIYSSPGASLILEDSTISDNRAGDGADGAPSSATGTDGGDGGSGGGIDNPVGTLLTIEGSTISGNRAGNGGAGGDGSAGGAGGRGGYGGGIIDGQSPTISDSTIAGNVAGAGGLGGLGGSSSGGRGGDAGRGGGIHHQGSSLTMTNVTLTGNAAGTAGNGGDGFPNGGSGVGGVGGAMNASGDATLRNVTIVANSAGLLGGGIGGGGLNVSETASIIAGNGVQNCQLTPSDGGSNVAFGDNTCPGTQADPKLGPLASNGGPTPTMALLAGSHAIDLVSAALCAPTDQRGVARPQGARCDAGAYEFAPPQIGGASAAADGPRSATVSASVAANLRDTTVLVHFGRTSAYGATSATQDAGAGGGAAPVSIQLTGLVPHTTYHAELIATNADGAAGSADLTFTTPSAAASGGATPIVSAVRQSSARWVQGNALARISRRHKLPAGTRFSFTLNEPAAMRFTFTRTASGRTVNQRCMAPTRRNLRRPRCRLTVVGGTLTFAGHSSANVVGFDGRLSRHRRLQAGRWTLVITATVPSGLRSSPHRLSFTIVRGRQ